MRVSDPDEGYYVGDPSSPLYGKAALLTPGPRLNLVLAEFIDGPCEGETHTFARSDFVVEIPKP